MAKYLLVFHIRSNGIQDYSREKIVDCNTSDLVDQIVELKEKYRKQALDQMGQFATSRPDDFRPSQASVVLVQACPL